MDDNIAKMLDIFFSKYKTQTFKKGDILINADQSPQNIFFLKKGKVKQYAISKKGEELIINVFKPNSFFPMSFVFINSPSPYYFEAIDEVEVQVSPKEEVLGFLQKNPVVALDLLKRVYLGTDGLLKRMIYLLSGDAYQRLVIELIIHAQRFGEKKGKSLQVFLSEKDIASKSGLTRETVSREIKILKEKKLVFFDKNLLTIPNLQQLESELS